MNYCIPTESFEQLISSSNKIVVIGHFNPDGDSIGSITGMYHYLKARGKDVKTISPSSHASFVDFLNPEEDPIIIFDKNRKKALEVFEAADLIICQDFNRLSRTEFLAENIKASKAKKVLIDHHPNPESEWFDIVISNTEMSSTCELVYHILMTMPDIAGDSSKISLKCAISLYSGILTDTNNFSNSLFPDTLVAASDLMSRGIDTKQVYYNLFCAYSESRMRLMGKMLEKMVMLPEYNTAYMLLSLEDKKAYNFREGDSEGFVNLPLAIEGVEITALLAQTEDFIRVSLRSKGDINVNDLAQKYFAGGGHVNASGGRLYRVAWSEVPAYFENAIAEWKKGTTFDKD